MNSCEEIIKIFILISLCNSVFSLPQGDDYITYDGHQVLEIHVSKIDDRQAIRDYLEPLCDVLKFSEDNSRPIDVLCPPESLDKVKDELDRKEVSYKIKIEDMGQILREHESPRARIKRQTSSMNWNDYQRYDTIVSWLETIASDNPSFTTLIDMGRSVEGRKLYALKIGKSPLGDETRAIWIDGGVHAREWVSPSTSTYIINKLVENFKQDQSDCTDSSVQGVDWYIAPLVNPDGYEYTHTNDRFWRKNRQVPLPGKSCYGVDLNRNWDVVGYGVGASGSSCSIIYKGTGRNSEPETKAVVDTILKHKDNIRIYISFHSYGQYWLTTYGYTDALPQDYDKQLNLAKKAVDGVNCINPGRKYSVGSAAVLLYAAGGASDDWAKITAKIPYSYTVELPNENSFVLEKSEIIPVGNELWEAMKKIAPEAARHPLGPDPAFDPQP